MRSGGEVHKCKDKHRHIKCKSDKEQFSPLLISKIHKKCNCKHDLCSCKIKLSQHHFKLNRTIVIDKPGYYTLCSNIDIAPTIDLFSAIIITSSNVTLDFKNHLFNITNSVYSTRITAVTVERNIDNVVILGTSGQRGVIKNFSYAAILVKGDTKNISIHDLLITADSQQLPVINTDNGATYLPVGVYFVDFNNTSVTFTDITYVSTVGQGPFSTAPYYVTFAIPEQTIVPELGPYYISGNNNTNYVGAFLAVASTTTTITFLFDRDPGIFDTSSPTSITNTNIISNRRTDGIKVENIIVNNYVCGINYSRIANLVMKNCQTNLNNFNGTWFGYDVNLGVLTVGPYAAFTPSSIEPYVENVQVLDCQFSENGGQPGVYAPADPDTGFIGFILATFGCEINRCDQIEFHNCQFNSNFNLVAPNSRNNPDSPYLNSIFNPTKGLDEDACFQTGFYKCQFSKNYSNFNDVEGTHYSGSFFNLKPNVNTVYEDCTASGNHTFGFVLPTVTVHGFAQVYTQNCVYRRCVASGNYINQEVGNENLGDKVMGFWFIGTTQSTDQNNKNTVFEDCSALGNYTNSGSCYGYLFTNDTGSVPPDFNANTGIIVRNSNAEGNVNTFSGDVSDTAGFAVLGETTSVYIVSTNIPNLGPLIGFFPSARSPPFMGTITAPAKLPPGPDFNACSPLPANYFANSIAVIIFTGNCGTIASGNRAVAAGAIAIIYLFLQSNRIAVGNFNVFNVYSNIQSINIPLIAALKNGPVTLTIDAAPSVNITNKVIFDNCIANANGNSAAVEGSKTAGFVIAGNNTQLTSVDQVVIQKCTSAGNNGDGFYVQNVKRTTIKNCEADYNTGIGFNDLDNPSNSVYLSNLSIQNDSGNYNVNYPTPLQVAEGTPSALPVPVSNLVNISIINI